MAIDVEEPGSPGWWLQRCAKKLSDRRPRIQQLADIMEGNAPIPGDTDPAVTDAYRRYRRMARTNYGELLVEALRRRLNITGFRTGDDPNPDGDQQARAIWDNNGGAVELADVLANMIGLGDSYMMLGLLHEDEPGSGPDPLDQLAITGEDPRQVVTIHDPVRQRIVLAASKLYHDDVSDLDVAYLQMRGEPGDPARVYRAIRERRARTKMPVRFSPGTWDWDDDYDGDVGLDLPTAMVPTVRFRNRKGVGVFEHHLDLLARLDNMTFRRDVIAALQAFKQRALFNTPDDDDDGNPIDWDDVLRADPGAMWRLPPGADSNQKVDIWESAATDIRPLTDAEKAELMKLCAVTSTPMHIFFPDAASGSAEGAALLKDEHVAKAEDVKVRANEGARDVMSIGFEMIGETSRSRRRLIQPLWAPTSRSSLTERADAASKAKDVPQRTRWTRIWGFSETEADQMAVELADEQLAAAALDLPVGPLVQEEETAGASGTT